MDFHTLPRRDLQALCKRIGIRANMTNVAMADALAALPMADGIKEFAKQAAATKSVVEAVVEEAPSEKKGSPLPPGRRVTVSSPEIVKLDDEEEENQEAAPEKKTMGPPPCGRRRTVVEEKQDLTRDTNEPALGVGRRRAIRRARATPVVAPTTRRRTAASKIETVDVAAEALTAPTTRRSARTCTETALVSTTQRTVQGIVAAQMEEKVPRGSRTTRRAASRMPRIHQEEEEERLQGVVSAVETTETAPIPVSDAGSDVPEEMDMEPLGLEQTSTPEEPVQQEEGVEVDTVENKGSLAQNCLSEAVVEEQEVDVKQQFNLDDSPILGVVSGTAVELNEEAPLCNSECPMGMLLTEMSSDTISEDQDAMTADQVPQATVEAEFSTGVCLAIKEVKAVNETGLAAEENRAKTADEPHVALSNDVGNAIEEEGVVATEDLSQNSATLRSTAAGSKATKETEFGVYVGRGSEEDAREEVEDNGADTVDEHVTLTTAADNAFKHDLSPEVSCAVEGEEVVTTEDVLQSSTTMQDDFNSKTSLATATGSKVSKETEFDVYVGNGSKEEGVAEAVNKTGFAVEDNGVETVDEHDTPTNAAKETEFDVYVGNGSKEEDVAEAANKTDFAVEDNGAETVDELDTLTNAAKGTEFDAHVGNGSKEEDVAEDANKTDFAVEENGAETVDELDTLTDAAKGTEFDVHVGNGSKEEDVAEAAIKTGFAVEDNGVETVGELDTLTNAAEETEFDVYVGNGSEEEDLAEAVNKVGFAVEDNGAETVYEHDTLTDAADNAIKLDFSAELSCPVEGDGVVATKDVLQSSTTVQDNFNSDTCLAEEQNELVSAGKESSDREVVSEDNLFTSDPSLKFDGPGDITSDVQEGAQTIPLFTDLAQNFTTTVVASAATVSEPVYDFSSRCMNSSSINDKGSTELVAMEERNEVNIADMQKEPLELVEPSLRSLRAKVKGMLIAKNKRKEEKKRVALARLDENVC